jgi:anti-sigma factor RsiW
MTAPVEKPSDIELMQYADGELDERDAARIRAAIERDPDARTKVEAIGQMSEVAAGHLELAADTASERRFEAMWREVKKEIDVAAPIGLWARLTSWLDRHRGHVITGAVSASAVAALALILRPGAPESATAKTGPTVIDVQPAALRAPTVIEDLETPGARNTVVTIEDDDGHMTTIVVTPEDIVEGI